ncbi:hypothetical protein [Streptomyces sp. NPDC050564]|uniref:hypothetical protein n=1 Tax=Streptomyces sp. NPDC050564 TaxID=3365631 RepID=UPI0037B0994C
MRLHLVVPRGVAPRASAPSRRLALTCVAAVLAELHDTGQDFDRRCLSESSMAEFLDLKATGDERRLPAPEPNHLDQ